MAAQLEELFNKWCEGRPALLHVYTSVPPSTSLEERYLSVMTALLLRLAWISRSSPSSLSRQRDDDDDYAE
eukprot:2190526-Karenia_brevis.AAC.1